MADETPKAISDDEVQIEDTGVSGEVEEDSEITKLWNEVDENEIDKKPEPEEKKKRGRPPKKPEPEIEKEEETELEEEKGKEEKKKEEEKVEELKPKTAKERIEEKQKEVEEAEKKEEAAAEKKKIEEKVPDVTPDLLFDLSKALESLPLTEEDKEFIKDFPESIRIMGAAQNAQTKQTYDEVNRVLTDVVIPFFDRELTAIRNRVVINEIVPEWKNLTKDPEKKDKDGNPLISSKFESWLKKQTPFYQRQFESSNPYDCAEVIVAYKEHLATEKVSESDRKKQEQLEKDKKKYGSSPKARKSSIPAGTEGKTMSELWNEVPEPD